VTDHRTDWVRPADGREPFGAIIRCGNHFQVFVAVTFSQPVAGSFQ